MQIIDDKHIVIIVSSWSQRHTRIEETTDENTYKLV